MTTTKHQYQLGQRVRFRAYMQRGANKWLRCEFAGKGVIAGKRNCTDGYTSWDNDGGTYHPTKHHTFWLVAYSLAGFRYVAEGDLEDVDGLQNQVKELEARIEEIEAEHGQELRGMRAFSIDLEARLKEAREETRQEANRANNAALRAEKNALRLKRLQDVIPNFVVLRSMADELLDPRHGHNDYIAFKLRQYAERIEKEGITPRAGES